MEENIREIELELSRYIENGKSLCITSSFQTHSLPLLHIVSRFVPDIPVLFIDTGFHFPETYAFRNEIVRSWNLNLVNLTADTSKLQQVDGNGGFLYFSDPEHCCYLNKVAPLKREVARYDVWVAGLRRDQTSFRKSLQSKEVVGENGQIKYHPILEWNSRMIHEYRKKYDLPVHPLEAQGFLSIGCQPCTLKAVDEAERDGRWFGSKKSECGIHLTNE